MTATVTVDAATLARELGAVLDSLQDLDTQVQEIDKELGVIYGRLIGQLPEPARLQIMTEHLQEQEEGQ